MKLDGANYADYKYDDAYRLEKIINLADSAEINFGYDNADRLMSRTYPNGVSTAYSYDNMSRLKRITDTGAAGTLFDRQYGYNTASQINQIAEPLQTRAFGYDNVDRLMSMSNGASNESYNYDDVGNRLSSHRSASYTYQANQFNRVASTTSANYNYDANGNLTTKAEGKELWRFTWDYENRLTSASTRRQTVRYRYDALGRRVQRFFTKGGSENTKFIYDGNDVLVDDNNGTLTKYLNGDAIDNKLRAATGNDVKYFLADHLGSTNALTDSSGNITSSASYDSFGNATGNLNTRYQYTGREFDNFTGLYFYRARWYDSNLGRFISEDPIGFGGKDVNWFAYVKNNPIFYKDPLGLITNPYYSGCVAAWTTVGAGVGFVAGGGLGLLTGPGAVVASPLGVVAGTAVGGAIGGGIGSLACGTPPFPNQADALPRTNPQPYPNEGDKTTCDTKPRPIPYRRPTPPPGPDPNREGCKEEIAACVELCAEAQFDPNMKHIWGGSRTACLKGCIPIRCHPYFNF